MLRVRFLPPTNLFACTALTPTHLAPLVERMWARHPDAGRGRPWRLGFADRVLLVALAYRTNLTERQLAVLFGVAPSVAHRVIADLARPWPRCSAHHRRTAATCGSPMAR